MNEPRLSSLPFECAYSRSASRSFSSAAVSALTLASKCAIAGARNDDSRGLSLARPVADNVNANRATDSLMQRVFIQVLLVPAERGCYDATRSPIDQTLSERPSREGAEGASFRPETLRQKNGRV